MSDFQKDILTGTVFVIGLLGFISGEFIISSTLFASAAIASNVNLNRKRVKSGQLSWD
jgi:CheY-specific phosphatase CheX